MFLENEWRYFRGYINIKVEGYFIERFFIVNNCKKYPLSQQKNLFISFELCIIEQGKNS